MAATPVARPRRWPYLNRIFEKTGTTGRVQLALAVERARMARGEF